MLQDHKPLVAICKKDVANCHKNTGDSLVYRPVQDKIAIKLQKYIANWRQLDSGQR